jgi:hypothetical protein
MLRLGGRGFDERPSRSPVRESADRRTHDDVTGVVDAGVNAREHDDRRGRPERRPEPG